MSVTGCDNTFGVNNDRWLGENVRFAPRDYADRALRDRAEQLFTELDRALHQLLCDEMSSAEREQVYEYLEDLHSAWETLQSDHHTFTNVRQQYGGVRFHEGGLPEFLGEYCDDQYRGFIDLAETTMILIDGFTGSGRPTDESPACVPSSYTATSGLYSGALCDVARTGTTGDLVAGPPWFEGLGSDRSVDSWITDPNEVLQRYESDPDGFYESFKNLSEEDRMLAMFSLQRAAQINSQIMQMVSNLLQTFHTTSMAVVRNLKA